MAIQFARCEYKSRSTGGNAVRSSAYNQRDLKTDEKTGETWDFRSRAKPGDLHLGVLLPEGAPEAMRESKALWNAAEAAERRKDSQVAKEIVLALPKELGPADWKAMARAFAQEQFVRNGVACQIDIHEPDADTPNPHAHILVTTRRLTAEGFEKTKARDLDPVCAQVKGKGRVVESEDQRWGRAWANHQNGYFKAQGLDLRVDPTKAKAEEHLGPKRFRAAEDTEIKRAAAKTAEENAAAWRDPASILEMMTRNAPTFRRKELDRQLRRNIADPAERVSVRAAVLADRDLVEVFDQKTGLSTGRYTTRQVIGQEHQIATNADALAADRRHRPAAAAVGRAIASRTMRQDQLDAFHHALNAGGLAVIQGRAGVGKSYTLGALAETYRDSGYTVIGLAPQHSVRLGMASDPNMRALHRAETLHAELNRVAKGKVRWDSRTAILVDEAGMVDSKTMDRLMTEARKAGAKLILTGDDRQLQSVARGGMFKVLAERHDAAEITEVTRQKVDWQRQAAEDLSGGRVREALTAFDRQGAIRWTEDHGAAIDVLVEKLEADSAARPAASRFVIAYTNADVHEINARVRAGRAERGELGHDVMLKSEGESKAFAVADRVQVIKTDKEKGLFNGTVGTVEAIKGGKMTLALDGGGRVTVDTAEFDGFRHGYAGTIYKSQGRTLDEVYMLHSQHWRMESTYVAMTRQKHAAHVFVGRDQAEDLEALIRQCSREDDRRAAYGYCTSADEAALKRRAWEAAAEKVVEADAFARGEHPAAARARTVRGTADRVSAYLQAREEAGELWAEIEADGMARQAGQHPAYPAFLAAQERRHGAVRAVIETPAAMTAMKAAGVVRGEEVAADYLMATGCPTRGEANHRARAEALRLHLVEPTAAEKLPAVYQAWQHAMVAGTHDRYQLRRDLRDLMQQISPQDLAQAPQPVQAIHAEETQAIAKEQAQASKGHSHSM